MATLADPALAIWAAWSGLFFGYIRTVTGNFSLALLAGGASLVIGSLIAVPIRSRRRSGGNIEMPP